MPRSVIIVGDEDIGATDSCTVCAFTTDPAEWPLLRLPVQPNARSGSRSSSRLLVDNITNVANPNVGARIGLPSAASWSG